MDFSVPERAAALADTARTFVREVCIPLEHDVMTLGFKKSLPGLAGLRDQARTRGLWAPQLPTSLGGQGLSMLEVGLLGEALGETPLGHWATNFQAPDAGNMELLHLFGSPEQQEAYLVPLSRGAIRSCFAMTEPDRPGSNPVWLETRAERESDGRWRINGHKWFTTGADGAAFAIVMAATSDDGKPHERATMFIVPMDTAGVEFVRNLPVMGEADGDWASHAELRFNDVVVPDSARLGDVGRGFSLAQERLGPGRIHHCMRWLGICRRAYDLMVKRAVERPLQPFRALGHQQVIQHWIAESTIQIEAARLMVLKAAWTIDAQGQRAARDDVAMIKVLVARTLQTVLDRAVQVHGAAGLLDDHLPLAWFYRHERAARIYDGPDEVHLTSIARRILSAKGLPG
jgi:alkylation response protein AidB-like acyl-CoA dehydrogenase